MQGRDPGPASRCAEKFEEVATRDEKRWCLEGITVDESCFSSSIIVEPLQPNYIISDTRDLGKL